MKTRKLKKIPIVIICFNELSYIENIIKQLQKYDHPIILLDNHSTYKPLFDYYKKIKSELNEKIEIRLLKKNYGNTVYIELQHTLPNIYILTDPDIELNENMPKNFAEIFLEISNKYKLYKVGVQLASIKNDEFINCDYGYDASINFKNPVKDPKYELYDRFVDTTFCLVNTKYKKANLDLSKHYMNSTKPALRIAGNFTAKHLPWYKNSNVKIPLDEMLAYVMNNRSSTLVSKCIAPKIHKEPKVNIFIFCFNEQALLPQTIKHYKTMLSDPIITIYDNESTDNSVKIAKSLDCKVVSWSTNNAIDNIKKKEITNNCWKDIKDGWVIICDMDEWLCVTKEDLIKEESKGTTILSVKGYNIMAKSKSVDFNDINLHTQKRAYYHKYESKDLCFRVPEIKEMNYSLGAHDSKPLGEIKYSSKNYINKHINDVGLPFLMNKMKLRYNRSHTMRKHGISRHYTNNSLKIKTEYLRKFKLSRNLHCDKKGYCE